MFGSLVTSTVTLHSAIMDMWLAGARLWKSLVLTV